jgi:hypothetical protein
MIHMGISRSGSGTNSANRREQEFPLEGVFQWQQFDHLLRQRRNNPPPEKNCRILLRPKLTLRSYNGNYYANEK